MDKFGVRKMKKVLKRCDIYRGNLILVNRDYLLKEETKLPDLEIISDENEMILLEKNANKFLRFVLREIQANDKIVPVSGYRTREEQEKIFKDSKEANGEEFTLKYVAFPDASEHQTGLAIDLGWNVGIIDFIRPSFPHNEVCDSFRKCAKKDGFIERYQSDKEDITHISAEEWHFRYVGYPHSEIIENNHFCLEEYISYLKQYRYRENPFLYCDYEISYLPFIEEIEIELENTQVSGNNVDGFIITRKIK